jgi:hypothetical protein
LESFRLSPTHVPDASEGGCRLHWHYEKSSNHTSPLPVSYRGFCAETETVGETIRGETKTDRDKTEIDSETDSR